MNILGVVLASLERGLRRRALGTCPLASQYRLGVRGLPPALAVREDDLALERGQPPEPADGEPPGRGGRRTTGGLATSARAAACSAPRWWTSRTSSPGSWRCSSSALLEHPAAVGTAQLRRRHAAPRHHDPAHAAHGPRRRLADRDRRPLAPPSSRNGSIPVALRRAASGTLDPVHVRARRQAPPASPRVYLYNWRSVPWLRWDSALLSVERGAAPELLRAGGPPAPGRHSVPAEPALYVSHGRGSCGAPAIGGATAACWRPSRVRVRTSNAAPS